MRLSLRNITLLATAVLMLLGCATIRPVPVQTTTQVQTVVKDSVVIHRDTVTLEIPVETSSSFQVQSSHLETTVALSDAYVDSTGLLNHTLSNKPFKLEKEIVYQDRVIETVRDSLVVSEKPIEVEVPVRYVPSFYKWCLAWSIISLLLLTLWLYFKLR